MFLNSVDFFILPFHGLEHNLDHEVNDLDPADEREACEEPHGASYSRQLVHKLGCSVLFDNIKEVEIQICTNLSLFTNARSRRVQI